MYGFELTPPRVETSTRRITWKDVVLRLLRLPWGKAYLRSAATAELQALMATLLAEAEVGEVSKREFLKRASISPGTWFRCARGQSDARRRSSGGNPP